MTINEQWKNFKLSLKRYPNLFNDLYEGLTETSILNIENKLNVKIYNDLRNIYLLNNGQKGKAEGIFKAVSGYNKYSRCKFLTLTEVIKTHLKLLEINTDVYDENLLVFACDDLGDGIDDVFVIDLQSGEIYLLWVAAPDPFLPEDWQTAKFKRGNNFDDFLLYQMSLY